MRTVLIVDLNNMISERHPKHLPWNSFYRESSSIRRQRSLKHFWVRSLSLICQVKLYIFRVIYRQCYRHVHAEQTNRKSFKGAASESRGQNFFSRCVRGTFFFRICIQVWRIDLSIELVGGVKCQGSFLLCRGWRTAQVLRLNQFLLSRSFSVARL